jgi:hypothetical protein
MAKFIEIKIVEKNISLVRRMSWFAFTNSYDCEGFLYNLVKNMNEEFENEKAKRLYMAEEVWPDF